jgi:hypothetical protein
MICRTERMTRRACEKEIQQIISENPLLIALKYVQGGWGEWYRYGDELI